MPTKHLNFLQCGKVKCNLPGTVVESKYLNNIVYVDKCTNYINISKILDNKNISSVLTSTEGRQIIVRMEMQLTENMDINTLSAVDKNSSKLKSKTKDENYVTHLFTSGYGSDTSLVALAEGRYADGTNNTITSTSLQINDIIYTVALKYYLNKTKCNDINCQGLYVHPLVALYILSRHNPDMKVDMITHIYKHIYRKELSESIDEITKACVDPHTKDDTNTHTISYIQSLLQNLEVIKKEKCLEYSELTNTSERFKTFIANNNLTTEKLQTEYKAEKDTSSHKDEIISTLYKMLEETNAQCASLWCVCNAYANEQIAIQRLSITNKIIDNDYELAELKEEAAEAATLREVIVQLVNEQTAIKLRISKLKSELSKSIINLKNKIRRKESITFDDLENFNTLLLPDNSEYQGKDILNEISNKHIPAPTFFHSDTPEKLSKLLDKLQKNTSIVSTSNLPTPNFKITSIEEKYNTPATNLKGIGIGLPRSLYGVNWIAKLCIPNLQEAVWESNSTDSPPTFSTESKNLTEILEQFSTIRSNAIDLIIKDPTLVKENSVLLEIQQQRKKEQEQIDKLKIELSEERQKLHRTYINLYQSDTDTSSICSCKNKCQGICVETIDTVYKN